MAVKRHALPRRPQSLRSVPPSPPAAQAGADPFGVPCP
jgi:hypothetical protein